MVGEWETFWRDYLARDMKEGFRMGFRYASHVRKQLSNGINYTLDASGIWGLLFSRRMVPVEVARVMVKDPHHSEETTSNKFLEWHCGAGIGGAAPSDAGVIIWQR